MIGTKYILYATLLVAYILGFLMYPVEPNIFKRLTNWKELFGPFFWPVIAIPAMFKSIFERIRKDWKEFQKEREYERWIKAENNEKHR